MRLRFALAVPLALSVPLENDVSLLVPHMDPNSKSIPSNLGHSLNSSAALAREKEAGTYRRVTVVSLCTSGDSIWDIICDIAHANFKLYTERHSYGLRFYQSYLSSRSVEWGKVAALYDAVNHKDVKYAFWMDADSLFMNFKLPLKHLQPENGKGIAFSPDEGCFINSGHMMFDASSKLAKNFLHDTWDTYPPPGVKNLDSDPVRYDVYVEQASMIYVLGGSKKGCRDLVNKATCGYSYEGTYAHKQPCSCCKISTVRGSNASSYFERLVDLRSQRAMDSTIKSSLTHEKHLVGGKYHAGDLVLHFEGLATEVKGACMLMYALLTEALRKSGNAEPWEHLTHEQVMEHVKHHVHNMVNQTALTQLARKKYNGSEMKSLDGMTYWVEAQKMCTAYNGGGYAP